MTALSGMSQRRKILVSGVIAWLISLLSSLNIYLLAMDGDWSKFQVGVVFTAFLTSVVSGLKDLLAFLAESPRTDVVRRPTKRLDPRIDASDEFDMSRNPVVVPKKTQNNFRFSSASERVLSTADADLVRVHRRALTLTTVDFACYESSRSVEKQRENIRKGVSWTMESRHLETPAKAIDHVPIINGKMDWSFEAFERTTKALKDAARLEGVACTHGIDWKGAKRDGPHTELDRSVYPYTPLDFDLSVPA